MNKVKASIGTKNGVRRAWVMLGNEEDEDPSFGSWLTPSQAMRLSSRLAAAATKADKLARNMKLVSRATANGK